MKLKLWHADALSDRVFGAIRQPWCPLEAWLDASRMQAIAAENNLAETAFFVERAPNYDLRVFTPTSEGPFAATPPWPVRM